MSDEKPTKTVVGMSHGTEGVISPAPVSHASDADHELGRMPLWEHLDELRGVLIRSLLAVLVCTALTYEFSDKILSFLEKPLFDVLPEGQKHLYFTGLADKFMTYLKVSIYSAIALSSPFLLYQVWGFVRPALYEKERKFAGPVLVFATLAFIVGMAFGYYLVIPTGYQFLIQFGGESEKPWITLSEYFSMTLQILICLGFVFELPVLMLLLGKIGLINHQMLGRIRAQAYVLLSILAAFITPTPDAFTMCLVMVPLFGLYEFSVFLVRWVAK